MSYGVGVDLGTTYTAAAVARPGQAPAMVALGTRSAAVPTIVALQQDGGFAVGDAAQRRAVAEPDRVVREFKRRVGDTVPVLVGGQPWSPEALLGAVLAWVLARVTEQEGEAPASVVVTHPANWGPLRRELLEQAAATAGGVRARFLTEPEAAAIHYASAERIADGTVVAVYDLGGGTFDATVLRKTADGFEVLGRPEGIERLGGLDVDAALLAHVTAGLGAAWSSLDPEDPAARIAAARLRDDVVTAKEALSEDPDVALPIQLPGGATEVRVTRGELEALVAPMIERSADALAAAIASAGLAVDAVDRILLVGGSSRMPIVSQILAARFARPLAVDAHPKHAVALGAARVAVDELTRPRPDAAVAGSPPSSAPDPVVAQVAASPAASPAWTTPPTQPAPVATPATAGTRRIPVVVGIAVVVVALLAAAGLALSGDGGDDDGDAAAADDVAAGDVEDGFCTHLVGLVGEIGDGALADDAGIAGMRETTADLVAAAPGDDEVDAAEEVVDVLEFADPADPVASAIEIETQLEPFFDGCGVEEFPGTGAIVGEFRAAQFALAGLDAVISGGLVDCSDGDCIAGSEAFNVPLVVTCLVDGCAISFDGADPAPFTRDGDELVASGPAAENHGLHCQNQIDPTTFELRLDVELEDDGETFASAEGTIVFEVAAGAGVSDCGPRTRTYEITIVPAQAADLDELAGTWFFTGTAVECVGLAEADCSAFSAPGGFTAQITIECGAAAGDGCVAGIATAEPVPIEPVGPPFVTGGGPLPDADGFQCDGAADPTFWRLEIVSVGDGTFDATITLDSAAGEVDGNSCVEERVVALGTAEPA